MATEAESVRKAMQRFLQAEADLGVAEIHESKASDEASAARISLASARLIHAAARRALAEASEEMARSGNF